MKVQERSEKLSECDVFDCSNDVSGQNLAFAEKGHLVCKKCAEKPRVLFKTYN